MQQQLLPPNIHSREKTFSNRKILFKTCCQGNETSVCMFVLLLRYTPCWDIVVYNAFENILCFPNFSVKNGFLRDIFHIDSAKYCAFFQTQRNGGFKAAICGQKTRTFLLCNESKMLQFQQIKKTCCFKEQHFVWFSEKLYVDAFYWYK